MGGQTDKEKNLCIGVGIGNMVLIECLMGLSIIMVFVCMCSDGLNGLLRGKARWGIKGKEMVGSPNPTLTFHCFSSHFNSIHMKQFE